MRKIALIVSGLVLLGCGSNLPSSSEPEPAEAATAAGKQADRRQQTRPDGSGDSSDPRQVSGQAATSNRDPVEKPRRTRLHPVLDVVDGDTVTVAYRGSEVSVRVIGIDTPETVHPTEPVECGGPQASATASALLSGKRVQLVFDPSQGRLDAYGRTLAYLRAPGVGDFGLAMIRRGRAAEYTYDTSYAQQARYQAAEAKAQSADRGIWRSCGGVDAPLRSSSEPAPAAEPAQSGNGARGGGGCDPNYDPCIPPYPPDLDCADVDGPIRVLGDDPHGFDADGDGIGCDS